MAMKIGLTEARIQVRQKNQTSGGRIFKQNSIQNLVYNDEKY